MSRFRYAHAAGAGWRECVERCDAQLGRSPGGLGFVYFTDQLVPHAQDLLRELRERTGVREWVGAVGIGIVATGVEYLDEPALAVMIADIDPTSYRVFSGRAPLPAPGALTARGAQAAHFAIVHADPETPDMPDLITDLSARLSSGYMVGGLSSSRSDSVQVANDVLRGGLSGALLASDVPVSTRLTQGCTPLPGRYTVTECEQNLVLRLDGRPALEVVCEAIGATSERDLPRMAQNLHVGLPVAGSDTGDYLVRNLIGFDPSRGLIAIGDYPQKDGALLFCRRDAASARRDLARMLDDLRGAAPAARGALYFSCLGRGEHMFGSRGAELAQVRAALDGLPLVGFFCNGEISHNRLYGYTGVLTVFH